MKHLAILLVALLSTLNISATWANVGEKNIQTVTTDSLRTADLLFVLNPKGNAITEVTEGVDHMPIDHVGKRNHQPNLISSVVVGRPRKDVDLKRLMDKWECYRGLPYDSLYMPDDQAMYCSELVQKMLYDNNGKPIYGTIPMSFHNEHGKITRYWRNFYHRRGLEVPEGKPGTNPGQISRDANTVILGLLITNIKKTQSPVQ